MPRNRFREQTQSDPLTVGGRVIDPVVAGWARNANATAAASDPEWEAKYGHASLIAGLVCFGELPPATPTDAEIIGLDS